MKRTRIDAGYLVIAAVALFWVILVSLRYLFFGFFDWNLAIHTQIMNSLLRHDTALALMGRQHFLANHLNLIAFPLLPFYALARHPLFLLYLGVGSAVVAAACFYRLVQDVLPRPWRFAALLVFLLYPALWHGILYEFDFSVLSVAFWSLMLLSFRRERLPWSLFWCILALLCKEDAFLLGLGWGVYAALFTRIRLRWRAIFLLVPAAYGFLSFRLLIPFFSAGKPYFYSFLFDGAGSAFLQPPQMIYAKLSAGGSYLYQLFAPVAFLPFLSASAVAFLPFCAMQLFSSNPSQQTVYFHYALVAIPFVFWGFLAGLRKLRAKNTPGLLAAVLVTCFLFEAASLPYDKIARSVRLAGPYSVRRYVIAWVRSMPAGARVVSGFRFLPLLVREHAAYAFHVLFSKAGLPGSFDYALLDFSEPLFQRYYPLDGGLILREFLQRHGLSPAASVGDIVFFSRAAAAPQLVEFLGEQPDPEKALVKLGEELALESCSFPETGRAGSPLELRLRWRKLGESRVNHGVLFLLVDSRMRVCVQAQHSIGYRMYPTRSWKTAAVVQERFRMPLPEGMAGTYTLYVFFYPWICDSLPGVPDGDREVDLLTLREGSSRYIPLGSVRIEKGGR